MRTLIVAVVLGLVGCQSEPEQRSAEAEAEPAQPVQSANSEVYGMVRFIRRNRTRRNTAADLCYGATECTVFRPDLNGKINLPENAKRCLEELIPKCQAAVDELEVYPAPPPLEEAYRKYAYEPEVLRMKQAQLALEVLQDYGKPPPVKNDGNGWEDFWSTWASKRYPKKKNAKFELMNQELEVRVDGTNALREYLNKHGVCSGGHNCYPSKVERGRVLGDQFQDAL